ncbi:MAG: hypothetical protein OXS29_09920 [bacterium]|nr:hypothetical protein [bacterium]MDE0288733.1 hypothetical protein [bacterium]MDE0437254.1 hypothetical protein [bacterium]
MAVDAGRIDDYAVVEVGGKRAWTNVDVFLSVLEAGFSGLSAYVCADEDADNVCCGEYLDPGEVIHVS